MLAWYKSLLIIALSTTLFIACKKDKDQVIITNTTLPEQNTRAVGEAGLNIISDNYYKELIVEIHYVSGSNVSATTLNNIKSFLKEHTTKDTIIFTSSVISSAGNTALSNEEVFSLEEKYRSRFTENNSLAVHILLLDANSKADEDDSKVLGIAYLNTSIALFMNSIESQSGGLNQPNGTTLQSTTLQHEFGHLFGLVNKGATMVTNHEDNKNEGHCDDENCLMYFSVGSGNPEALTNGIIPEFDQNCLSDLSNLK